MQLTKVVVLAAGGQQPLRAARLPVELIVGKIGDRQLIESRASEARN